MSYIPRYIPNAQKALEVILWIVTEKPGFDVYHVVKAAFFADKYHLRNYGRPICGDLYSAAPFGPLPQVVYNLLKRDPIEMIALDSNGNLPLTIDNAHRVYGEREPNLRRLSETDREALKFGVKHVDGRRFDDIYGETHDDPAYFKAEGLQMDYRDFLAEDDPLRDDKAEMIEETARSAVF